jgi:hypothetical protein
MWRPSLVVWRFRLHYSERRATVVEVKSSHVPMLSRPNEVLAAIRKAAAAVAAKRA